MLKERLVNLLNNSDIRNIQMVIEDLAKISASSNDGLDDQNQHLITFKTKDWVYAHDLVIVLRILHH